MLPTCGAYTFTCHIVAGKYSSLGVGYSFTPVAIETLGAMGKKSLAFLKDLGHG